MANALATPHRKDRAESLKRFDRPDRGLWRFLTWSFFVAQLGLGAPLVGNESKRSTDQQDDSDQPAGQSSASAANDSGTPSSTAIRMSAEEQTEDDDKDNRVHAAAL